MQQFVDGLRLAHAMNNFVAPEGINLRSEHELLPEVLSVALVVSVSFLKSIESGETTLYQYADWWEHDGLHFPKGILDFAGLAQMVYSPSTLLAAMPGDFSVFVGIAPQDFSWYLRFYLDPDAEEEERFGRFDLTLRQGWVEPYTKVMKPLGLKMQAQAAAEYYLSI